MNIMERVHQMFRRTETRVRRDEAAVRARELRVAPILNANRKLLEDFRKMENEVKGDPNHGHG